ncbi:MAG: ribonuclease HII [Anaerolineae bacterium]|nr:ribonuclease HII [Anaerolineae bacterium]
MAKEPITAGLTLEREALAGGHTLIAGLDEAGRGAWAGPVAAAAVILPLDNDDLFDVLEGVTDSKRLRPEQREALAPVIQEVALGWAVGRATNLEIDEKGIIAATLLAMERALRKLDLDPDYLLIDALTLPAAVMPLDRQRRIIKGDQLSLSIAAASILAKVARDDYMVGLDELYPEFGFANHKGYGTREHQTNLTAHGPCRAHRHSFKPILRWHKLI